MNYTTYFGRGRFQENLFSFEKRKWFNTEEFI